MKPTLLTRHGTVQVRLAQFNNASQLIKHHENYVITPSSHLEKRNSETKNVQPYYLYNINAG